MHEELFHADNVPQPRAKARWDDEELVLLAREEVRLMNKGVKNVNQELMKILPHCSLQSIKGVRRSSNKKYQHLLSEFRSEVVTECSVPSIEEPARGGAHSEDGSSTLFDYSDQHHGSWWAKMKAEISACVYFGGLDVDLLRPDCLTEEVRQLVDLDFGLWMESITARKLVGVIPKRRPRRKPREGHGESTTHSGLVVPQGSGNRNGKRVKPSSRSKQKGRRETFKKVQDLFRKNKGR